MTNRFVVLLRGINVGGKNKLPMAELRDALEDGGFGDVSTYIQSGNIAITAPTCDPADITAIIADRFGYDIPVVIRTAEQLRLTVANNPLSDLAAQNPKWFHVYFCQDQISSEAAEGLDHDRFSPDRMIVADREVYVCYQDGVAGSKLTNAVLDRTLGQITTARNWNTVVKLVEMVESPASA